MPLHCLVCDESILWRWLLKEFAKAVDVGAQKVLEVLI